MDPVLNLEKIGGAAELASLPAARVEPAFCHDRPHRELPVSLVL
jgi:hypothetical protein